MRNRLIITVSVIAASALALTFLGVRVSVHQEQANAEPSQLATPPAKATVAVPADLEHISGTNFRSVSRSRGASSARLDRSGRYFVSFGDAPKYHLTVTYPSGESKVILEEAVMNVIPIPQSDQIAFTAVGENRAPYPVYVIAADGTGIQQIGSTETPWRLQVTDSKHVAFREDGSLVLYNLTSGKRFSVPGVELKGEYGNGDTMWQVSPDASHVAVRDGNTLVLWDINSGETRTITADLNRQDQTLGAWSPDSTLFAYGTEPESRTDHPSVWIVGITQEPKRLFHHESNVGQFWDFAWLDSQRLMTNYFPRGPLGKAIPSAEYYVVSSKTGGGKLLFTNGKGLAIAQDGRRIFIDRQTEVGSLTQFEVVQVDIAE